MQRQHLTDTFRNWEDLEYRFGLALAQIEHDPESYRLLTPADAIVEEDLLEAEEREETAILLQLILDAATGMKPPLKASLIQIIPNNAAIGLNLLADVMLMTPPGERTRDVQNQQAIKEPLESQQAQTVGHVPEAALKSPNTSKIRSSPITPRSQPFIPTISAIMNDPESTFGNQAQASMPATDPGPGSEKKIVEEQRQRKRPAAEIASSATRIQSPAVTIEPLNAPARQAMATQTSSTMSQKDRQPQIQYDVNSKSEAQAAETQKRVRRRPGPRAIYTKQTAPDIVAPSQQYWSPFTHSMGPPTHIPKHVTDEHVTLEPQDEESGNHYASVTKPLPHSRNVKGASGAHSSDVAISVTSAPMTSPRMKQLTQNRVKGDIQEIEKESHQRPSLPVHSDQLNHQQVPVPVAAPSQSPYNWPHQNIYYQPQTFYGPYSPAPGVPTHNVPPPVVAQYVQHSAPPPPVPQYPPAPAAYQSWSAYPHNVQSAHPAHPPGVVPPTSRPSERPRQSSNEYSKESRRSSTNLPSIASMIPAPSYHPGIYHYPPVGHAWPHPLNPHQQHGAPPPTHEQPRQYAPPNGYYQPYSLPEDVARRSSHVPLLTPSAKPLPSYVQGRTQDLRRSADSIQDVKSPNIELNAALPEHRTQAIEQARRSSKESVASGQMGAAGGRSEGQNQPRSQTGPNPHVVLAAKPPNVRAPAPYPGTRPPPAGPSTAQQAPVQHPNFRGQRPKHHEWRNWTSAVPPPSSGANNSPSGPSVSVTMIGASNGAGPYSSGNRKRRNKGIKGSTPQPEPEVAAHAAGVSQEPQAPPSNQQLPNPWHREFRFESQNQKFEGL